MKVEQILKLLEIGNISVYKFVENGIFVVQNCEITCGVDIPPPYEVHHTLTIWTYILPLGWRVSPILV